MSRFPNVGLPLLCLAALVSCATAGGSTQATIGASPTVSSPTVPWKGVAFSPPAGSDGIAAFFQALPALGGTTSWSGDWAELDNPASGAYGVSKLASAQHSNLIVIVSAHQNNGVPSLLRPLNDANRSLYLSALSKYFASYQPRYFGIGIEINNLYESDPQGYRAFVSLFAQAATRVHELSPNTEVFTVFQLEKLKGLSQGLLANTRRKSEWQLLSDFPNADLLAFTSYPFLAYNDPSQMPNSYYSEITQRTSKPVGLSEVGWPSRDVAAAWPENAQRQQQFVGLFAAMVARVKPQFALWLSAYDQLAGGPTFSHIGLAESDRTHKPAWSSWVALSL